jgi:hypothetical protein
LLIAWATFSSAPRTFAVSVAWRAVVKREVMSESSEQ